MTRKYQLFLCVVIAMRLATGQTANASYLFLAGYALLGRAQAVQALALSWLFSMFNPALVAESSGGSAGRFVIILAAALSVLFRSSLFGKSQRVGSMTGATLALGLLLIGHSLIVSPIPDVSILKSISWTLVTATLFAAWRAMNDEIRDRTINQIFGGLIAVLILSLPLLILPVGYSVNGSGFQGILGHPQAFGPTIALLGVWAGARMLGERRPPWRIVLLMGACLVLTVLSEARTAGLAFILGLASATVLLSLLSRQSFINVLPGLVSRRFYLIVGTALVGTFFSGSVLTDRFGSYIDKRSDSSGLIEAYQTSRGGLIASMFENITKNPLVGIGFGIASQPEKRVVDRESVFGLPIGAVVEKGVLPYQVVEELGLLGTLFVMLWFGMAIKRALRGTVTSLAVMVTVLLLNLGESTFFSPGGMGLLPLILFTWAVSVTPGSRKA